MNVKIFQQLKSGFERTISWNKYQSKVTVLKENRHFDYLIDLIFQGVNRLSVFSFENNNGWASYIIEISTRYHLPQVQKKDYNVMIDERNFFDQLVINNLRTYDNIQKIATGQGDDCKTGCLLDYPYFQNYYKMIDLSKQETLDADPKAMRQINFTANLDWPGITTMFFIIVEEKETFLDFSQETVKVL